MMGLRDSLLDLSWNESVTGYWKVFTGYFLTYIYIYIYYSMRFLFIPPVRLNYVGI